MLIREKKFLRVNGFTQRRERDKFSYRQELVELL
jgi:hypothetical protein